VSTWEMVKFWFIRETMPLWIALAVIALLVLGCVVWAGIETLRDKFRNKPNAGIERPMKPQKEDGNV
jgi:peptidoglycan/LPS O-acetylase OafA/YrhL